MKFLDSTGLGVLWNKIKANFYTKTELSNAVVHNQAATISGDLTPSALAQAVSTAPQNLTDAQQAQARSNIGSDKYGVVSQTISWRKAADNGYDYTISNKVYGNIPNSNVDLFINLGATFNETSGYFELNGITDIAYDEIKKIFSYYSAVIQPQTFYSSDVRTMFKTRGQSSHTVGALFRGSKKIKNIPPLMLYPYITSYDNDVFYNCNSLEVCQIGVYNPPTSQDLFRYCYRLKQVEVFSIARSIYIQDSPLLEANSIKNMINRVNTASAITITLHPTAYARAIADSNVQAALAAHTNVTLAQAS